MNEPKWLTQDYKDLLAEAGIDWQAFLQKVANAAQKLLILIQLLGGLLPSPAQGTAKAGCEHHACCCDCLKAAVETVNVCADHCCNCCDLYC